MRVLITGSSGFVGSHITRVLRDVGYDVVGLDRSDPLDAAQPSEFVHCDVTDSASLTGAIRAWRPAAIVHGAAITPGPCELEVAETIVQVNLASTLTALLAAAAHGCKRFILLSSAAVYADPALDDVLTESSPVNDCGGLYAQTKLASERLCHWAARELGLSTVALRIGPVYGELERPTEARTRTSPIHQAVALATSQETIRCNSESTLYNWIYGDDVGRAVIAVLDASKPEPVYNVSGPPYAMGESLRAILSVLPPTVYEWTVDLKRVNLPVVDRSRPILTELIRSHLGFQPSVVLGDGIERVVTAMVLETL